MMRRKFTFAGMVFALSAYLLFSVSSAMAQVSFTDNRIQFLADNAGLVHQNFEDGNVPPDTFFYTCDAPENSQSNDDCFSPHDILPGILFSQDPFSSSGILLLGGNSLGTGANPPAVLMNNTYLAGFEMKFIPGASAAGMYIGCVRAESSCADDVLVEVFGTAGLLGSTVVPVTSDFNNFLGVSSSQHITRILINDNDPSTLDIRGVLSVWFDIETNPIPALSEWGMIAAAAGLGLAGVFFAMRRPRASKRPDAAC